MIEKLTRVHAFEHSKSMEIKVKTTEPFRFLNGFSSKEI